MSHVEEGLLHAWLDGALDDEDRATGEAIERHLAVCAECRERLDEALQLRDEVAEILAATTPPGIEEAPPFEELVARAEWLARATSPRRDKRLFFPLAWAATLVLALGAGWWAHHLTVGAEHGRDSRSAETTLHAAEGAPDEQNTVQVPAQIYEVAPEWLADRVPDPGADRAPEGVPARVDEHSPSGAIGSFALAVAPPQVAEASRMGGRPAVLETRAARVTPELSVRPRYAAAALKPIAPPPPADGWFRVDHAAAEAWAGAPLVFAPGFPVVEFAIAQLDGTPAVRITQELPDGNLIEVVQLARRAGERGGGGPGLGRRLLSIITWIPSQVSAVASHGDSNEEEAYPLSVSDPEGVAEQIALLPRRQVSAPHAKVAASVQRSTADPLAGADSVELRGDDFLITVRALLPPDSLQNLLGVIRSE